ncbi:caspase domain-containing protein [Phormidesmis sp. 146-12]
MARNQAIVIGINQYEFLQPLRYAKQDALLMREFLLKEAGFDQVFFFSDDSPAWKGKSTRPSRSNLLRVLREIEAACPMQDGDNFWFFFSGHGMRGGEQDYLMPLDGDPHDIQNTGISINHITDRLRGCGADNVVLMLDACREGGRKGGSLGEQTAERSRQTGMVSLFSCSPHQYSYEIEAIAQGAFTKALLEGLGHCATVERLSHYLERRVPEILRDNNLRANQTPYTIAEPIAKSHLVLMPKHATLADAQPLKMDALEAEANEDYRLAEQCWIRVLVVSPGDRQAIDAIKRLDRKSHLQSAEPLSPQPSPAGEGARKQASTSRNATPTPRTVQTFEFDIVRSVVLWPLWQKTERRLRLFIAEKLEAEYKTEDWIAQVEANCPNLKVDIFDPCRQKQENEKKKFGDRASINLLDFAYPLDLYKIIAAYWTVFQPVLKQDKKHWEQRFSLLIKVRTSMAHMRDELIASHERQLAEAYCDEILYLLDQDK